MSVTVRPGDPYEPGAKRLLEASHALMQSLFPPEDNYFLSLDALKAPNIRFFVAEADGAILGTGALALMDGYGEVKSMFTDEAARGRGVAGAMLDRLEAEARRAGVPVMRLETGHLLETAHRLYAAKGFVECGRYGDYVENATSLFMEKRL